MRKAVCYFVAGMFLLVLVLLGSCPASATANFLRLELEGKPVSLEEPIQILQGRSLLPMRTFFELCGAKIVWDGENDAVIAEKDGNKAVFPIGSQIVAVNGEVYKIDVPALLINNRSYIPIRAAGESLGYGVRWLPEGRVQMGHSVASDGKALNPYNVASVATGSYDRQWFLNDRKHFADLLRLVKTAPEAQEAVYKEYLALIKRREEIEKSAYTSPRGYTIYSPSITEKLNTLEIALQARSLLLRDIKLNRIGRLDDYYEANYNYFILWNENTLGNGGKIPEIVPTKPSGFDPKKIAKVLDSLPVPNKLYYGLKIWYLSGYPKESSTGGFFHPGYVGNFEGYIVVYDLTKEDRNW